jgi:hypothetical protein
MLICGDKDSTPADHDIDRVFAIGHRIDPRPVPALPLSAAPRKILSCPNVTRGVVVTGITTLRPTPALTKSSSPPNDQFRWLPFWMGISPISGKQELTEQYKFFGLNLNTI